MPHLKCVMLNYQAVFEEVDGTSLSKQLKLYNMSRSEER